jgi:hypothetical protein
MKNFEDALQAAAAGVRLLQPRPVTGHPLSPAYASICER